MAGGGKGAVFLAMLGNGFLAVIKFIAFFLSRSPALLSEAIHSVADTSNQALMYIGIRRSTKPADRRYNWGYGGERYLFALLSAVGIFILGAGVTVYHGVASLLDPPELEISWISYAVLITSLVVEGFVLYSAVREVNAKRGDMPLGEFVRESSDPTLLAVLFEDSVACIGVIVALVGIGLAEATGAAWLDAVSSIIIGVLLGVIAIWLGWRNRTLILGPAIPRDIEDEIREFLISQPSIEGLRRVRTRIVASERFAFAAEIDWDGAYLGKLHANWVVEHAAEIDDPEEFAADFGKRVIDALAREIDRIERAIQKRFPRLRHLDLESDLNPDVIDEPYTSGSYEARLDEDQVEEDGAA